MIAIGFFITMIEAKKRKPFLIQERRDILAQVDVSMKTLVALFARLGIVPSTLNTIVKTRKTPKGFMQMAVGYVGEGRVRNSYQSKTLRVCCLRG